MKAIQLVQVGRPLAARDVAIPRLGPHDVLVAVKAAGICHSDAHYRAGVSPTGPLPVTPGHEVAGVIESVGPDVDTFRAGDRACLHYIVSCGSCRFCTTGREQFCESGQMIGKDRDGGYAEYVVVPSRSVVPLPDAVPFAQGAVMMCSSATALHAIRKSRLSRGETVAIFGIGGLGVSALQLARLSGAGRLIAVDVNAKKLALARTLGAETVDASREDPVRCIADLTGGRGADVAIELIGLPAVMQQAVRCLAVTGRAVIVGLTDGTLAVSPYHELINRETEVIGCSDHTRTEIEELLDWYQRGSLSLPDEFMRRIPLEADPINSALDGLDGFGGDVRVVIDV